LHPPGQGPLLLVQGSAPVDLPDPDEVPRRGPAPRRSAARPRIHHEGRLLLRRRRRRPRRLLRGHARGLPARLRPPRTALPAGRGDPGSDGRIRHRGIHLPLRGRRGHLRPLRRCYAANVEAVTSIVPDPIPYEGTPAAHVEDTPDTPTIETLVAAANANHPREDREWTAADTLKHVVCAVTHPDGTRQVSVIGLPGD